MKKMNLITLLFATMVLFSVKTSVAQNTTFKLSDYKNPDYFYQTLDLNFGLNSASEVHNNDNSSDYYNNKTFSIGSNARADYSSYANSRKSQSEFRAGLSGSFSSETRNNSNELVQQQIKKNYFSHYESVYLGGLQRFYNQKLSYFEIGGSLNNTFNGSSGKSKSLNIDTVTNSTENSSKNFTNSSYLSILIGKGRIEQVQDARMALYLIEDLHRLNRDKRPASDEDVLELAKLITSLKYKRFFDNRLRKIAEITAIDSFMQQKGIVSSSDATYFTSLNDNWVYANNPIEITAIDSFMQQKGIVNSSDATYFTSLNDNWDYANNPVRNSGWRIYTGIEGSYNYNYSNGLVEYLIPSESTTEKTSNLNRLGIFVVAGLNYEKPINLKWQNSASFKARFGTRYEKSNTKYSDESDLNNYFEETPAMEIAANYGFGYYPNSRTWLTVNWQLTSSYKKQFTGTSKDDKENSTNRFFIYTGPNFNAYYYLSEKLRLSLNYNGYLHIINDNFINNIPEGSDDNQTETLWNNRLTATLTYSLF